MSKLSIYKNLILLLYFYRLTIWTFCSLRLFPSIFPPSFTYTTTHFLNDPFRPATTHMTEIFKRMFAFFAAICCMLLFRKGCREFYIFLFFFCCGALLWHYNKTKTLIINRTVLLFPPHKYTHIIPYTIPVPIIPFL